MWLSLWSTWRDLCLMASSKNVFRKCFLFADIPKEATHKLTARCKHRLGDYYVASLMQWMHLGLSAKYIQSMLICIINSMCTQSVVLSKLMLLSRLASLKAQPRQGRLYLTSNLECFTLQMFKAGTNEPEKMKESSEQLFLLFFFFILNI